MSQYRTGGKLSSFNAAEDRDALQNYVESAEHGRYPRTLLIGLGGTGAKALQHLRRMKIERFGTVDLPGVAYLSMDTDLQSARPEATKEQSPYEDLVSFDETQRINLSANLNAVLENMARHPHVKEWWDDSALDSKRNFDLGKGAGQIRPLSRLVFFQNRELIQSALERCWSDVTAQNLDDGRIQKGKVRIVVVAGLAGVESMKDTTFGFAEFDDKLKPMTPALVEACLSVVVGTRVRGCPCQEPSPDPSFAPPHAPREHPITPPAAPHPFPGHRSVTNYNYP